MRKRIIPALVVATGLVVSLAACSGGSPADQVTACSPTVVAGKSSVLIETSGSGEPTVNFPTPIVSKKLERSFVTIGEGEMLSTGDVALIQLTQYNGGTSELIGSSWKNGAPSPAVVGGDLGVLSDLLDCTPIGSRLTGVIPAELIGGDAGSTAVVTLDVIDGFKGKADGTPQLQQNGLPSIVTAPNGRPGFTIPSTDAPTKLTTELLQAGSGAKVKENDTVFIQYTGVSWNSKSVTNSSWVDATTGDESGFPLTTVIDETDVTDPTLGSLLLPGTVKTELVGKKVGSQVLIVIPGDADATVYVVDILGIQ